MKAKVKKGHELLFLPGCDFSNIRDDMIINFRNRYTYRSFRQKGNHLLIDTTEGEVDIVFTGEVPELKFGHFEKDQLVLDII